MDQPQDPFDNEFTSPLDLKRTWSLPLINPASRHADKPFDWSSLDLGSQKGSERSGSASAKTANKGVESQRPRRTFKELVRQAARDEVEKACQSIKQEAQRSPQS